MSTILNALRKAKQEPRKDTVDARREILADRTHDYLATIPDDPEQKLRLMKILVGMAGLIILALGILVVYLLAAPRGQTGEYVAPVADASPAAHSLPEPRVAETPHPQVSRVEIIVSTPPQPTPIPASPAVSVPSPPPAAEPAVSPENTGAAVPPEDADTVSSAVRHLSGLRVNGIVWSEKDPMAMIDGQTVQEGSRVSGAIVRKINRDSVVVVLDGETITLRP